MKKIILTLGLSVIFTTSPALAESLIDQSSLTFDDTRTIYLKPFIGYGNHLPKIIGTHAVCSSQSYSNVNVADITSFFPIDLPQQITSSYSQAGIPIGGNDPGLQTKETLETQFNINQMAFAGIDVGGYVNDYFSLVNEIGYHYFQDSSFCYKLRGEMSGAQVMSIDETLHQGSIGILNFMLKPVISMIHTENFSFYVTGGVGVSYTMLHGSNTDLSFKGECDADKITSVIAAPSAISKVISTNIQQQFKQLMDHLAIQKQKMAKMHRDSNVSTAAFQMSWMLGAGLTININNDIKFDIGYSYKSLGYIQTPKMYQDAVPESTKHININCHAIYCGVRAYL